MLEKQGSYWNVSKRFSVQKIVSSLELLKSKKRKRSQGTRVIKLCLKFVLTIFENLLCLIALQGANLVNGQLVLKFICPFIFRMEYLSHELFILKFELIRNSTVKKRSI